MKKYIFTAFAFSLSVILLACQNATLANSQAQQTIPVNSAAKPGTQPSAAETKETEPIWDPNTVVLESQKLAENVYAIVDSRGQQGVPNGVPMATSGGFIVGAQGVLMIDTMLNQKLSQQARNLIAKVTDKPIIYAVNTSYHGDHSYGNMYLPAQTKIIQHEHTQSYLASNLEKDKAFMIANFGKGRGIEEIKLRKADLIVKKGETYTLDLGGRQVKLIDFGFAQTGGDLFVWDQGSKTMWTGNPILAHKPSLPWLLDGHFVETRQSLQAMYDFLPADVTLIPGHGIPMKKTDIDWHLNYMDAVKVQVQSAIQEGLSYEQTVKKVTLDPFRGYQIFDWVHPGLNVPAAYQDLSKKE